MTTILVTGFTPFGEISRNPSAAIVALIAAAPPDGITLITEILPTAFGPAGERIRALVNEAAPDAVVCLGVAQNRAEITPERFALNVNDAPIPDNEGKLATGSPITPGGPAAYRTTLPVEAMVAAISALGLPAKASNHAGAYVCNHVFYCLMDELARLERAIPAGFIHVPMASDFADQPGADRGLPLDEMARAIRACLELLDDGGGR